MINPFVIEKESYKLIKVIESTKTKEQLISAYTYYNLWFKQHTPEDSNMKIKAGILLLSKSRDLNQQMI